jgi:hypothetical protein
VATPNPRTSVAAAYQPEERDAGRIQWPVPSPPWQTVLTRRRPPCLARLLYDPLSGYHAVRFGPLGAHSLQGALLAHGFPGYPNFWVGGPDGAWRLAVFRRGVGISSEFLVLTTDPDRPNGIPNGILLPYSYALVGVLEALLPVLGGCPRPDDPPGAPAGASPCAASCSDINEGKETDDGPQPPS